MRQKYFDSTEYNYQYYYKIDRDPNGKIIKEGKEIGGEERCHSVFSNVQYDLWLISYEECPPLDWNELNDNLKKKNYGKIILENGDGGNRPNETAIEAWLLDYEKLMMNKDTTSQEAIYQVRSRIELYLFDWFSPYELIVEAQNINLRAITAFGSTSRRLQVSLSIRHLHRNLLLNVIIHLTFLVIGEFYDRVKRSSTKNQLDRSIML